MSANNANVRACILHTYSPIDPMTLKNFQKVAVGVEAGVKDTKWVGTCLTIWEELDINGLMLEKPDIYNQILCIMHPLTLVI